jgi:hypothetical protein
MNTPAADAPNLAPITAPSATAAAPTDVVVSSPEPPEKAFWGIAYDQCMSGVDTTRDNLVILVRRTSPVALLRVSG